MARKVLKLACRRKPRSPHADTQRRAGPLLETGAPPMGVSVHRVGQRVEGREIAMTNLRATMDFPD